MNFSETSAIGHALRERGVRNAEADEHPDIIVVNTCSVTEMADKKGRNLIRSLHRRHPDAAIVVTGCYAQLKPGEVSSIPGVEIVLGAGEKLRAAEFVTRWLDERRRVCRTTPSRDIREFVPTCESGDRTRWFLKVQDGCDYFCTYCTIPFARGFSRNPSIESLVNQARQAAAEGGREIVLTGVNIGDFGKTTGEKFIDLVRQLDKVEGIERYRISSLEPDLATDDLIDYCATSRAFMPHFHIPLQSGSDEVLQLMHRHYDTKLFADKIRHIKRLMPDAFIGVDVMVGCRGETPECFEETYEFLESLDVTQLHVFPYSERPGTAALKIPYTVDDKTKKERSHRLLELSDRKTQAFYERHIGSEAKVLFEKAPRGKAMHGFTENYIRVELPPTLAKPEYDNTILTVHLGGFNHDKTALFATLN